MNLSYFQQSFFRHVDELRSRIFKSACAYVVALLVCYNFISPLIPILAAPAGRLYFTSPGEAFWAYMVLDMVLALFLALPYILYQVWAFVSVALLPVEKKYVLIFTLLSLLFFISGAAFALFVAVPLAFKFLMSFSSNSLSPLISVRNYLGFLGRMTIAFGLAFELPLVLALLARLGLVSEESLKSKRRHAIIVILIAAAILAPPDIASMTILALPLMFLYELGIIFVKIFHR